MFVKLINLLLVAIRYNYTMFLVVNPFASSIQLLFSIIIIYRGNFIL